MINKQRIPLLVICGQTATGKTDLAFQLAKRYNGEIICADSRTVYRGMDIGTAKPSADEQAAVKHWGLDLVDPGQRFTVADFKKYAQAAISDISARGNVPIIAGGSGLYIDAVLFDFDLQPADELLRAELNMLSVGTLQARIKLLGYTMPENDQNKRYLIRTIERAGVEPTKSELRPDTLLLGLRADPMILRQRIAQRVYLMLEQGFIQEVQRLLRQYPADTPALQAPGYKAFQQFLTNKTTIEEATAAFIKNDYQLAKRQLTWFKRNKSIHWLVNSDNLAESVDLLTTFLQNKH